MKKKQYTTSALDSTSHTWQKGGCFWPSDLVDDVVWRPSTMFGFGLLLRVLENWSFHSRARLWQNTISHLQLTFKVNTQANTSHSATKVKYAVLWYIPTTDPCSSSQGLSWRIRKSPKEILIFLKLSTYITARAKTSHSAAKFKYAVLWYVSTRDP